VIGCSRGMHRTTIFPLLLVACSDSTPAAPASPPAEAGTTEVGSDGAADASAFCDRCLEERLKGYCDSALLGAVIAVVETDGRRHYASCGHADLAKKRPVVVADRFRVGSITKTFTASLALGLVDEGALSLDATPESQGVAVDGATTITLRNLLGHTSGLFDYNSDLGFDWSRAWTIPEVIAWVTDRHDLMFEPGKEFSYSGTGYQVVSEMIGAKGRPSYAKALRARVLDKLALRDTFLQGAEAIPGGRTEGSRRVGTAFVVPEFPNDWASADGSLVSNVDDLLTFASKLLRERTLISTKAVETMVAPTRLPDGTTARFLGDEYGLGVFVRTDPRGPIYLHGGADFGFSAFVGIQPATGHAVAFLTNTEGVDPRAIAQLGWEALGH